ncbi:MAG: hypothetical protein KDA87_14480 [Planctomycetales bacterium]|nr:hypothetical protein [Planctomycetales bacterium]
MNRRIQVSCVLLVATSLSTSSFAGGRGAINVRPKFQQRWNAAVSPSSHVRTYRRSNSGAYHVLPATQTIVHPPVVVERIVEPVVVAPIATPAVPQIPTFPAGATLALTANFLGEQTGSVFLVFDKIKLPVAIQAWTNNGVTVTLPAMAIKEAVQVRLDVVRPDGSLGMSQTLRITCPAPVIVHTPGAASPLPTRAALSAGSPGSSRSNALVAIAPAPGTVNRPAAPTAVMNTLPATSANSTNVANRTSGEINGGIVIHDTTPVASAVPSSISNQPSASVESTMDWDSNPLLQDTQIELQTDNEAANPLDSAEPTEESVRNDDSVDDSNLPLDESLESDNNAAEAVIVPEPNLNDGSSISGPWNAVVRAFRNQVPLGR